MAASADSAAARAHPPATAGGIPARRSPATGVAAALGPVPMALTPAVRGAEAGLASPPPRAATTSGGLISATTAATAVTGWQSGSAPSDATAVLDVARTARGPAIRRAVRRGAAVPVSTAGLVSVGAPVAGLGAPVRWSPGNDSPAEDGPTPPVVRRSPLLVAPPRGAAAGASVSGGAGARRTSQSSASADGSEPTGDDQTVRRSLLARTSHLFRSNSAETPPGTGGGNSLPTMAAAGSTPGEPAVQSWQRARPRNWRDPDAPTMGAGRQPAPATDDGELFERIVNALEARVIAELERRGQHRFPGVF